MFKSECVNPGEIEVGKALPWGVYDSGGMLLLKKGMIITTERQLQILLSRGLYRCASESPRTVEVTKQSEDNTSPFTHLVDFCQRLSLAFSAIRTKSEDAEKRITKLATDIQKLCAKDADALIGAVHIDHDSDYVLCHPIHNAILCEIFAKYLEIPEQHRLHILCAALTANISILELQTILHTQSGPMSEQQKSTMQAHPLSSVAMLNAAGIHNITWLRAVEQHHERNDGNGYPNGAVQGDISKEAKIIALCDLYSAMVVAKSYRAAHPANDILRTLFVSKGKEFDETLCLQLIKIISVYPPGSFVRLQNGETAVVIKRPMNGSMWPTAASILSPRGGPYAQVLRRNCNDEAYRIKEMISLDKSIPLNLHKLWNYK